LIGFTVTNGATLTSGSSSGDLCGGGVWAHTGSVVSNCVIAGNAACGYGSNGEGGGGVYRGTLHDCRIVGNRVGPGRPEGGGVFNATLHGCLLAGNTAEKGGGAYRGALYRCVVSNNLATGAGSEGGGVCGASDANPVVVHDSTIAANSALKGGGVGRASHVYTSDIVDNVLSYSEAFDKYGAGAFGDSGEETYLVGCRILRNTPAEWRSNGGGLYNCHATNCTIAYNVAYSGGGACKPAALYNCLVYGNSGNGGGVFHDGGTRTLESCTIVGNTEDGVRSDGGTMVLRNCVVYSNDVTQSGNWLENGGTVAFSNTCTTPAGTGWDGSNTDGNPLFVTDGSGYGTGHVPGDYRLSIGSPCLNAGMNLPWMVDQLDLGGAPRIDIDRGRADMGCYEYIYRGSMFRSR
jgi:hypothetical protein